MGFEKCVCVFFNHLESTDHDPCEMSSSDQENTSRPRELGPDKKTLVIPVDAARRDRLPPASLSAGAPGTGKRAGGWPGPAERRVGGAGT